ncbi:MAG: peptidylprolyl isomerase [Candidatus Margulisiibacteriota bacterium]
MVEIATNQGSIIIELNPKKAPNTVRNFLDYVDEGFYDGTIFHRVIDGFMIQGGGFESNMKRKDTKRPIRNESNNGLSNVVGTIAMARTNDPNSATSQFYINVANNTFLNYKSKSQPGYCVFGRVIEGINIVQKIKQVPVGNFGQYQNVPDEPVVIKRIRRVTEAQLKEEQNITIQKETILIPESTD